MFTLANERQTVLDTVNCYKNQRTKGKGEYREKDIMADSSCVQMLIPPCNDPSKRAKSLKNDNNLKL